jgi:hypothetical protein
MKTSEQLATQVWTAHGCSATLCCLTWEQHNHRRNQPRSKPINYEVRKKHKGAVIKWLVKGIGIMWLHFISVNCQMLYECFITYIEGNKNVRSCGLSQERYPWTLGAETLETFDALPTEVFLACPSKAFSKPQALAAGQHVSRMTGGGGK